MRLEGKIEKGWGCEKIWVTNEHYCSKFMEFNEGAKFSMHFHKEKIETWYIISGEFEIIWIDTKDATHHTETLGVGSVWHNDILVPHQVICIKSGTILEVSTADSVEDNYRVLPGDSQK